MVTYHVQVKLLEVVGNGAVVAGGKMVSQSRVFLPDGSSTDGTGHVTKLALSSFHLEMRGTYVRYERQKDDIFSDGKTLLVETLPFL